MRRVLPAILAATVVCSTADGAQAQNFFQLLFGGQKPYAAQSQPAPAPIMMAPPGGTRRGGPIDPQGRDSHTRSGRGQPTSLDDAFDPSGRSSPRSLDAQDDGGTYTTVCVRLCDGFYWPLHHSSRRRDFQRDARQCESSCGEDARLFTMANRGTRTIDTAVDLKGNPYSKLPTALFYRKTLINGCACRPSPWSPSEVARHGDYVAAEEQAKRVAEAARVAAWAAETPAPHDSFRAAQEIGLALSTSRVAARKKDAGEGQGPERSAAIAAPYRVRTERAARADTQPEPPRVPRRVEPRPQQQASAPAAPSGFKSFSGFGGSSFAWPGDPVRR